MFLFSLFGNLHFALEIVGALAFGMVGWLAVDAFLVIRDFKTIARGIGFSLLALAQVLHAFHFGDDLFGYAEQLLLLFGLVFVVINLVQESPVDRPMFRAIVVLPAIAVTLPFFQVAEVALYAVITILAYLQMRKEFKYVLRPFILAFSFFTVSSMMAIVVRSDTYGVLWASEHLLRLAGFFCLAFWVWSYLKLRIREELLFILISTTLFMAVIVSLSFSTITVRQLDETTKQDLAVNTRVLDLSIGAQVDGALAKATLVGRESVLRDAIRANDFATLEVIATEMLKEQKLGFLVIANAEGEVLMRAHAVSRRDDNIGAEFAAGRALLGETVSAIESSSGEGFSLRAASPVMHAGKPIGVVVLGYQLDNAFADSIKRLTGLDISIYEKTRRVATTEFERDGRTRSNNLVESNPDVLDAVFARKEPITLSTSDRTHSAIASYLPLRDAGGEVVGMLEASRSARTISESMDATNRLTLAVVVVIMLILSIPLYLITRRLGGEVV